MLIQNGLDMANLTRDYLKYIKTIEEPIMHHHLLELKHPQWGSIIGYENQIRIAVLKDEMEMWQERMKSGDIFTLESRIMELEDKEIVLKRPAAVSVLEESGEERVERWKTELKESSTEKEKYPNELRGPGPDEEN